MILDLFVQFAMELARAIMIDALSARIRGRVSAFRRVREMRGAEGMVSRIHRRNRDRLFHRLRTEEESEL